MGRKLEPDEKLRIQAERYEIESAAFPDADIEVIVDDDTYANGEPKIRVVSRGKKDKDAN